MNPFEPGSNVEIPSPPFEVPTPDLPAADFVAVGHDIAKGQAEAGWFDGFWDALVARLAIIVGNVAGVVIKLFGWAAVYVARIFLVARQNNEDTLAEASGAAIGDLFGIPVQSQWFKSLANSGQRQPMAKNAAEGLLEALGGSFGATSGSGIQPSSDRAEKYVTTVMNLCIEGWLEGWIMEALSAGQLETFSELKDICANALGLGRMTRRVLAPALKILVEDPFTWKLNTAYRPGLLSSSTCARQLLRGRMTREQVDTELGYQGWSADRIEAFINEAKLHLPVSDLVTSIAHNELDASLALQMLRDQGYDDTQAQMALRIEHLKRGDTLTMELARLAIDAWNVGTLTEADLSQFINQDGITEQERVYLGLLKDLKGRTKRKQFSLAQAETMVKQGIWDLSRFQGWAFVEGYTADDERDMELLLFAEIKTAADAAAARAQKVKDAAAAKAASLAAAALKRQETAAALAERGVALSKYETLVKDGIRTIEQYRAFLVARGVSADNQDALIKLLQNALAQQAATAASKGAHTATAAAKNLNLGELDKAVRSGVITIDEYQHRIEQAGFAAADVSILVAVATEDLAAAATRAQTKADAKAAAAVRHVDIAQEERAVRLGLKTLTDFQAFLTANKYAEEDAALLVDELQKQMAADTAAQATRASAVTAAKKKGLSLGELEQAVRAGVKTMADYQAALASLGYAPDAQAALASLLQLKMDTDTQSLAAHGTAAALLGQRGVSLADLERAVKLGVVPIAVYTAALGRVGLSADDGTLLTLSLAAQVAAAKKAAKPSVSVNTALKAAGLSAAGLRTSVLKGELSIDEYQTALLSAGVDAQSVAALVSVMAEELVNQQAIDAKLALAAQRAGVKGLSLSQEEAAVKAGVKTLDDFSAFVAGLGFDPADVATLTATLAAQLNKAAAAKKPPAPPPAPAPMP